MSAGAASACWATSPNTYRCDGGARRVAKDAVRRRGGGAKVGDRRLLTLSVADPLSRPHRAPSRDRLERATARRATESRRPPTQRFAAFRPDTRRRRGGTTIRYPRARIRRPKYERELQQLSAKRRIR